MTNTPSGGQPPPRAHLVLSPHPDDAVWSAGGRIGWWLARGESVTVLTVFSGIPDGQLSGTWRNMAEPAIRRIEDQAALACLGATLVQGDLPDAALRAADGQPRYESPRRLFGPVHHQDRDLVPVIAAMIDRLADAGMTTVHGPLAAGRHVDHVLVRWAAESIGRLHGRLTYYEDFPYHLTARDRANLVAGYEPVRVRSWLTAAACYRSQIPLLLGSDAALRRALLTRARGHGRAVGLHHAERVWTRDNAATAQLPGEPA